MTHDPSSESTPPGAEADMRLWCVEGAHLKCLDLRNRARLSGKPTVGFVIESQGDEKHVRSPHFTYVLGPYPDHEPTQGITAVHVRTLTQYYYAEENGDPARRDTPLFSDTFVELVFGSDGPRDKYLITREEISEYDDVDRLRKNPDIAETGNLYVHTGEVAHAPGRPFLSPQLFLDLLQNYGPLEQNNDI